MEMWYRQPKILEAMAEFGLVEGPSGTFSFDGRQIDFLPNGVIVRSTINDGSGPYDVVETSLVSANPDEDFLNRAIYEHVMKIMELAQEMQDLIPVDKLPN
jgi:hypothetical protein